MQEMGYCSDLVTNTQAKGQHWCLDLDSVFKERNCEVLLNQEGTNNASTDGQKELKQDLKQKLETYRKKLKQHLEVSHKDGEITCGQNDKIFDKIFVGAAATKYPSRLVSPISKLTVWTGRMDQ